MPITFNKHVIGSYDYESRDGNNYHIEVRQGNCDGVHIWIDEHKTPHLFNFVGDAEHIKNMVKHGHDVFSACKNIRFNIYDKGAKRQAEYACKMGHEVTITYNKIVDEN